MNTLAVFRIDSDIVVIKMPVFKFVINDRQKSFQVEKEQNECPIIGKKINDTIEGSFLGLDGYELKITGGTDKDGFAMHPNIEGVMRRAVVLTKGIGFRGKIRGKKVKKKPRKIKGLRKRKLLRGNTISPEIVQINCKVTKTGSKPLEEILVKTEKKKEDKKE